MNHSDYIALGGLVISIFVAVWSYCINRKLNQQQEIINKYQIDSYSKADIKIEVSDLGKGKRRFVITNIGYSPAKNIRIDWNGLDKEDKISINEQHKLPYPILNNGDSFSFYALLYGLENRSPIVFILWEDDCSKNNRKEVTISL